jgi:Zn-dependent protease
MPSSRKGSFHLFRVAGIDLFLHWSWFLVAAFEINSGTRRYSSLAWNVLEYLTLFLIVLLHEFGHVLACRQVGGQANQIMLWPLGGMAYVDPPQRPGAYLWTMTAGPLVNVALLPVLTAFWFLSGSLGWIHAMPNAQIFLRSVLVIDIILLIFNMLPIYPLDGGQILRSLLWFVVGRARSLMVVTILGVVGVVALLLVALWIHSVPLGVLSLFMLLSCWAGLRHAMLLTRQEGVPSQNGAGSNEPDRIINAEYTEIVDPKLQSRLLARYDREISSLQALGFRNLAFPLETLGPYSAILQLPVLLSMLTQRNVLVFSRPLRWAVADVLLVHAEPSSIALCFAKGVKIYTRFSDQSVLISATFKSQLIPGPHSPITKNVVSPTAQEAWHSHKEQVLAMENQGRTIANSSAMSDYIELANCENNLTQYVL